MAGAVENCRIIVQRQLDARPAAKLGIFESYREFCGAPAPFLARPGIGSALYAGGAE